MLINIAHLAGPDLFGNFGGAGRACPNPLIDTFIKPFGNDDRGHAGLADLRDARRRPRDPRRRLLRRLAPRPGRRRRVEADAATGEAVIG